jgi:predicted flap endonuclease-1-like 5' DNA nuclease
MLTTTATILFLLVTSALAALAVHETLGSGRRKRGGVDGSQLTRVRSDVEELDAAIGGIEAHQEQLAKSLDQRFMAVTKEGAQHEAAIAAAFREAQSGKDELRGELDQLRMVIAALSAQVDSAQPSEERFAKIERSLQSQDMRLCTLEESIEDVNRSLAPDNTDLKRIKGIGATLEKTLKGLGIETIDQVANLGVDELEVLSVELGAFAKRIERDAWVDQAKALMG